MQSEWQVGAGLAGKAAIVTGAASGIGRATAVKLAEAGARVLATDIDDDGLSATLALLPGSDHVRRIFDLRDTDGIDSLVADARDRLGRLDVLAHAGALLRRKPLREVTAEDWDAQHDVDLKATFFLDRAAAEAMKEQGRGGRIVNFTTAAWLVGARSGSDAYVAAKAGVIALTRGFAEAYGPYGILVNVIAPGQIDTPMQHVDNPPEVVQEALARNPLGRMGRPEEVAAVVVFLASDHASFVSGATITVSGGAATW
jgi:NAD(P)-dependent dehydrogenase (short-subunit alcohol dehydrogenase family)